MDHMQEAGSDRAPASAMARTLAALYAAGASTGALTVLLPHSDGADETVLWSNVAIALAASLVLLGASWAPWVRPWICQAAVAVGTLVITRAILAGGEVDLYSLWYLWVALYTFFYFGRAWGAAHMALVAAAFGIALIAEPTSSPLAHWVMTVGTITIAGVLIDALAGRVRRQAEQSEARARALSAVSTVAHELARRTSPVSAAPAVCESALEVTGAAESVLWEPNGKGNALVATAATQPDVEGATVPFVSTGTGLVRAFVSGEAEFEPVPPGEGSPAPSVAAAIAMERAKTLSRLERVAAREELTGLDNRRSWDEHLKREVERARRSGSPLTVALLDLDHFKRYNDRFGHQAGDRLLKEVASNWQRVLRATDILARYGGEEFALALPGASLEEAMELLERLRAATPQDERVSAGVVEWGGRESGHELVSRADQALYGAKRGGRDRVVSA